jgi:hypothetical protein
MGKLPQKSADVRGCLAGPMKLLPWVLLASCSPTKWSETMPEQLIGTWTQVSNDISVQRRPQDGSHHASFDSSATDEAIRLCAFASAQYPPQHRMILDAAMAAVIDVISSFALNARRAIEVPPKSEKFPLAQSRWKWAPTTAGGVVRDFWDALNRVIQARRLEVGFEELPKQLAVIDGGEVVVPYVQAATDRKELAFIDPFALSHGYLYGAYPKPLATQQHHEVRQLRPDNSSKPNPLRGSA